MTNRNYRLGLILSCAAVCLIMLAGSSCYTILRHPRLAQADLHHSDNNSCFDCHTEEEVYYYHHPVTISRPPVAWDDALYSPWWYDAYWSDDSGGFRYRDNLRATQNEPPAGFNPIRAVKPPSAQNQPIETKVETAPEQSEKKRKKETPRSQQRKLRPKKKANPKDKRKKDD